MGARNLFCLPLRSRKRDQTNRKVSFLNGVQDATSDVSTKSASTGKPSRYQSRTRCSTSVAPPDIDCLSELTNKQLFHSIRNAEIDADEKESWTPKMVGLISTAPAEAVAQALQTAIRRGVPDSLKRDVFLRAHKTAEKLQEMPTLYSQVLKNTFGPNIPDDFPGRVPTFAGGFLGVEEALKNAEADIEEWEVHLDVIPDYERHREPSETDSFLASTPRAAHPTSTTVIVTPPKMDAPSHSNHRSRENARDFKETGADGGDAQEDKTTGQRRHLFKPHATHGLTKTSSTSYGTPNQLQVDLHRPRLAHLESHDLDAGLNYRSYKEHPSSLIASAFDRHFHHRKKGKKREANPNSPSYGISEHGERHEDDDGYKCRPTPLFGHSEMGGGRTPGRTPGDVVAEIEYMAQAKANLNAQMQQLEHASLCGEDDGAGTGAMAVSPCCSPSLRNRGRDFTSLSQPVGLERTSTGCSSAGSAGVFSTFGEATPLLESDSRLSSQQYRDPSLIDPRRRARADTGGSFVTELDGPTGYQSDFSESRFNLYATAKDASEVLTESASAYTIPAFPEASQSVVDLSQCDWSLRRTPSVSSLPQQQSAVIQRAPNRLTGRPKSRRTSKTDQINQLERVTHLWRLLNQDGLVAAKRVLWCIASEFNDVEFCPILPPLLCVLLCYLSEREAFVLLSNMLFTARETAKSQSSRPFMVYRRTDFIRYVKVVVAIASKHLSKVTLHLISMGVDVAAWIAHSLQNGLARVLPFNHILRLFTSFLFEGVKVLMRYALAVIKVNEERLLSCQTKVEAERILRGPKRAGRHYLNDITKAAFHFQIRSHSDNINHYSSFEIPTPYLTNVNTGRVYRPRLSQESRIIGHYEWEVLWSWIPCSDRILDPFLVYRSETDGMSLLAMQRKLENFVDRPMIFLVKATGSGEVIGGFFPIMLFATRAQIDMTDKSSACVFQLYPVPCSYSFCGYLGSGFLFSTDKSGICIGLEAPAIHIDADLFHGKSDDCKTFDSPPLASEMKDFTVSCIEVWSFT